MALSSVQKTVSSLIPWKKLKENIASRQSIHMDHFTGSSAAFAIAELKNHFNQIAIVFPDFERAQILKSDLDQIGGDHFFLFPPTGQNPYDEQQITDSSLMVQRSEVLEQIISKEKYITVTSASALFEKVISPETFDAVSITLTSGDEIDPHSLKQDLADQEYRSVNFVDEPGEFAHRGGIMDIYPYSGDYPVRLEFFGDEIESIREFDPDSQRSISYLNVVCIVPDATNLNAGERDHLFSYFDDNTLLLLFNTGLIEAEFKNRYEKAAAIFEENKHKELDPPGHLFVAPDIYRSAITNYPVITFGGLTAEKDPDWTFRLNASPQPDFNGSISLLRKNISELSLQGYDIYILCDNEGQRDRFDELLEEPGKKFRYHLSVDSIHEGFILKDKGLAVYTDHQIFNRYHRPKTRRKKHAGGISRKELRDLNIGDYVVHVDYGIGKFAGFKKIKVKDILQESVVLKYKEDSVLYVNVSSLHKIQKYSGKEGTQPRITKLGSGQWARKKAQTKKRVKDIARDLIKLYAKRKSREAYKFDKDNSWQTELEARFEFEETPDQRQAIEAVKNDMEQKTPMDRLVCGDVGFGKTEVAVRAAFKAVMDHKQVAVLVPTTILADQHYKTFSKRMKEFPVSVDVLSRFRTRAEQNKTLKKLKEGQIDIIIGTHRLTSKDVEFNDLGLLVVDEEQRFGVSAKEKLKEYRATVDVLTLTATPIPRTLQFSLMGARDLSIINTPPPNRQPVDTRIHSFDKDIISDAITQEVSRGGQVFFIHNRVKNIEEVANMVRQLIPDIRVRFAHGQMSSAKLEKIITDFYQHKFDVLVSTNIVENGIDISNANTMIINRADRFGLAELHQLRGRVGRSNRKAFCFLITPPIETLTNEARKRLLALEEFSDLGSGFNIAMRDLDIRGAGDLLGAEQSGYINDVGFELYQKILNDAVKELKEEEFSDVFKDVEIQPDFPETTVEFDRPALLENHYISDNVERLNLYRKLARSSKLEEIEDWKEEVRDRFGPIPEAGQNLILAAKIKLFASRNFFTKITVRSERMWIVCPRNNSETGKNFYDDRFQPLLKKLQEEKENELQVVQKNSRVRFVIHDIGGLEEAAEFLESLSEAEFKEATLVE